MKIKLLRNSLAVYTFELAMNQPITKFSQVKIKEMMPSCQKSALSTCCHLFSNYWQSSYLLMRLRYRNYSNYSFSFGMISVSELSVIQILFQFILPLRCSTSVSSYLLMLWICSRFQKKRLLRGRLYSPTRFSQMCCIFLRFWKILLLLCFSRLISDWIPSTEDLCPQSLPRTDQKCLKLCMIVDMSILLMNRLLLWKWLSRHSIFPQTSCPH